MVYDLYLLHILGFLMSFAAFNRRFSNNPLIPSTSRTFNILPALSVSVLFSPCLQQYNDAQGQKTKAERYTLQPNLHMNGMAHHKHNLHRLKNQ